MIDFLREAYRHGKPILAIASGADLLDCAGIPTALPDGSPDPRMILAVGGASKQGMDDLATVLARHRIYARETDPPRV